MFTGVSKGDKVLVSIEVRSGTYDQGESYYVPATVVKLTDKSFDVGDPQNSKNTKRYAKDDGRSREAHTSYSNRLVSKAIVYDEERNEIQSAIRRVKLNKERNGLYSDLKRFTQCLDSLELTMAQVTHLREHLSKLVDFDKTVK
jgi:hypothetical protein